MNLGARDRHLEWVLALAGLVFGIALIGLVKDRLAQIQPNQIGPLQVEMGALPPWLEGHRGRLLSGASLLGAGPRSLYDPKLGRDLRDQLLLQPWVQGVSHLRRQPSGTLRLRVRLRSPYAVVCVGGERLAVDQSGVVLESESRFGPPEWPEIHLLGEDVREVPVDGGTFERVSVLAALAVLRAIEEQRRAGHPALSSVSVESVLVGFVGRKRRPGAADIQLQLAGGTRLLWGRSPLAPLAALELPVAEKLDHLERTLRTWPGLVGIIQVDLRARDPLIYLRTD